MSAGYTPDRFDLESVVNDVEGDMILLSLAITDVFGPRPKKEGGWNIFELTDEQVRAITHADARMHMSVRALSKTFYGPEAGEAP